MKHEITEFWGGIASSDRMGPRASYAVGQQIDPFRDFGYLVPGFSPTLIDNSDTVNFDNSRIKNIVAYAPNADAYIINSGTRIHRITSISGDTLTVADNTVAAVGTHAAHTTFALDDFIIININGTDFGFYSWNDDTDGDIGRVSLPSTYDDDYFSSTVTSAAALTLKVPHIMKFFQNTQKLYITNGRNIISMTTDAATPTADMTALKIPFGWIATTLEVTENYLVIGAVKSNNANFSAGGTYQETAVFMWDGVSTSWNRMFPIEDNTIRGLKNLNGDLFALTQGRNRKGAIRIFTGNKFELASLVEDGANGAIGFGASVAAVIYPGVVNVFKNRLIFGTNSANIYTYGSGIPGLPAGLYMPWRAGAYNEVTAVTPVTTTKIYAGAEDTTNGKTALIKLTTGYDTNALWRSLWFEAPQKIVINYVTFYFKSLATGQNATVSLQTDYGNSTVSLGTITFGTDGAIERKTFKATVRGTKCSNFRVVIDPDTDTADAVAFARIIVDYSFIEDLD